MPRSNYEYPGYEAEGLVYWTKTAVVYIGIILGAIWMIFPFWVAVMTSVSDVATTGIHSLVPTQFTLKNYIEVWNSVPILRWFLNSIIMAGTVTLFNLTFDTLAGYALARLDFWGRDKLFILFISTMMVPFVVLLIPLFLLVVNLNWINTYQGLIVPFMARPLGIFLLRQHFKSLPSSLGDAARIDGCNEFQVFYKAYLPLAKPAVATLGIFTFVFTWKNFTWPLIVADNRDMFTLPLAMFQVQSQYFTDYTLVMATAVIIVTPSILVFLSAQKYFLKGLTLSGTKG